MPLQSGSSHKVSGHNFSVKVYAGKSRDKLPGENPPDRSMKFYAPIKLSDKMSETREGFLVCHDVAIARTGEMLYKGEEIPDVQAGRDGIIRITRDASDLFTDEAMASFEGKPLTDDHPPEDVRPENWSKLAKGTLQNVRRGEGDFTGFLLGDILVMDKDAIEKIRSGEKREVSLGYDADYEQVEVGQGRQKNIVGNHIALVSRGRCGSRCSIRDRSPDMKISLKDALLRAFKAKDAAEVEELAKQVEQPDGDTHVHVHMNGGKPETQDEGAGAKEELSLESLAARMSGIEDLLKRLTESEETETEGGEGEGGEVKDAVSEGEGEKLVEEEEKTDEEAGKRKTQDAASVYTDFAARAEVLAPGVRMPRLTKDAMADPKKTMDGMCLCKRRALDAAMKFEPSKKAISKFLNTRDGATIEKLTCDRVDAVFIGASELVKAENNSKAQTNGRQTKDSATTDAFARGGLDKIHRDFWANKK